MAWSSCTFHFPSSVSWLTSAEHLDPLAKIREFKVTAVRLEKVEEPIPAG